MEEKFTFTIEILQDSSDFYIPLNGYYIDGVQHAPYNWIINWGDDNIENKSGQSSPKNTNFISHLYTPGKYTITIAPVQNNFSWMRAWGTIWGSTLNIPQNAIHNASKIISFDYVTNKSFMESETSYGSHYMAYAFCSAITNPITEIQTANENLITYVDNFFRAHQYEYCIYLSKPSTENLSNSIISIGEEFRRGQYAHCYNLLEAAKEYLPSTVLYISKGFRDGQYMHCEKKLELPVQEYLPDSISSLGSFFRCNQYGNCHKLKYPAPEYLPNDIVTIGNNFRRGQYMCCYNLGKPLLHMTLDCISLENFRYEQYKKTPFQS